MGLSLLPRDLVVARSVERVARAEQLRSEWWFWLVPDAFEGGGAWLQPRRADRGWVSAGSASDASRSMQEAGRRARTKMRRYAVANRCDRMITLTYAEACHDRDQFVADLHSFWVDLRAARGGTAHPYLWVPEWHKSHGLHAHAAVSEFIPFTLIRDVWVAGGSVSSGWRDRRWAGPVPWSPSGLAAARGIWPSTSARPSMTSAGCWDGTAMRSLRDSNPARCI